MTLIRSFSLFFLLLLGYVLCFTSITILYREISHSPSITTSISSYNERTLMISYSFFSCENIFRIYVNTYKRDLSMVIWERDGEAVKKFMNMSNNESITGKLAYLSNLPIFFFFFNLPPPNPFTSFISLKRGRKKFYVGKLELELLEEGLDLISFLILSSSSSLKIYTYTHNFSWAISSFLLLACAKLSTGKMVIFSLLQLFLILSFSTSWWW